MRISETGISLIKRYEGFKAKAYLCPAGMCTIGYGETEGVKESDTITIAEADKRLRNRCVELSSIVSEFGLTLTQNQFDAVVSFCYNLGVGAFQSSTLFKKMKADANDTSILREFKKWVYAGGEKLPGLIRRREEEATLYFTY